MSQKQKILIPPTLVAPKYGKLQVTKKDINAKEQLTLFTNPQAEYSININPSNKELSELIVTPGIFNYLNICGDLIVSAPNTSHLHIYFYANSHAELEKWGQSDFLKSKNLTINTPQSAKISIHNSYEKDVQLPLETLTVNTYFSEIEIDSIKSFRTLKINPPVQELDSPKGWHTRTEIILKNLPNLKEVDLSSIKRFNKNNLKLSNLPNNCVFSFSPDSTFDYRVYKPSLCCDLKSITGETVYHSDVQESQIKISELFPNKVNSNPVKVTFLEFKKALIAFSNKIIKENLENELIDEKQKLIDLENNVIKENYRFR